MTTRPGLNSTDMKPEELTTRLSKTSSLWTPGKKSTRSLIRRIDIDRQDEDLAHSWSTMNIMMMRMRQCRP